MPTQTANRNSVNKTTPVSNNAFGSFMGSTTGAALTEFGVGKPKYAVMAVHGNVKPVNTLEKAFSGYGGAKAGLKIGECGFVTSDNADYNGTQLAYKTPKGGIVFVKLQHDKDGNPMAEKELVLCELVATETIFVGDSETIAHEEGDIVAKAVPQAYLSTLAKA